MIVDGRPASQPSARETLCAWFRVGIRSFGGGPATLFLIRQVFVEEGKWFTDEQYARMWALCQLTPGINILAMTILIGRKLRGAMGVALALLGLLIPSAVVTVLIAAGYAHVQHAPAVRAALRGIVPATVGIGLAAGIGMGRPPFEASRREGTGSLAIAVLILVGAVTAMVLYRTEVFAVMMVSGGIGAIHQVLRRRSALEGPRR